MKSAFIYLLAIVISAGVTFALAARTVPDVLPSACEKILESVMVESAGIPLSLADRSLKGGPDGWEVLPSNDAPIKLDRDAFLRPIGDSVLLSFVVVVLTLFASWHWQLGRVAGITLAIVCGCLAFFGVPAASGLIQGIGIVLIDPRLRTLVWAFQILPFIAPILIGAAIGFAWLGTRWAMEPETPHPKRANFLLVQRACLLAAAASALTVAAVWGRIDFRARDEWSDFFHNGQWGIESTPVMLCRAAIVSIVAFSACLLVLRAFRHGESARLPWIMMLFLLPLGPEAAGAGAFLLMVVCDFPAQKAETRAE